MRYFPRKKHTSYNEFLFNQPIDFNKIDTEILNPEMLKIFGHFKAYNNWVRYNIPPIPLNNISNSIEGDTFVKYFFNLNRYDNIIFTKPQILFIGKSKKYLGTQKAYFTIKTPKVTKKFNKDGLLIYSSKQLGPGNNTRSFEYEYNQDGNIIKKVNLSKKNTTVYEYTDSGLTRIGKKYEWETKNILDTSIQKVNTRGDVYFDKNEDYISIAQFDDNHNMILEDFENNDDYFSLTEYKYDNQNRIIFKSIFEENDNAYKEFNFDYIPSDNPDIIEIVNQRINYSKLDVNDNILPPGYIYKSTSIIYKFQDFIRKIKILGEDNKIIEFKINIKEKGEISDSR
jgi:hypothetical protein